MQNGQQPALPLPPVNEPLQFATGQLPGPDGLMVVLTLAGPGRSFQCVITGEIASNWAKQLEHYGRMSESGLFVQVNPS